MKLALVCASALVMVSCGFSSSGKVTPTNPPRRDESTTPNKPTTPADTLPQYSSCGKSGTVNALAKKDVAQYHGTRQGCFLSKSPKVAAYNEGEVTQCGCVRDRDLSGQDLSHQILTGIDLRYVKLNNANLSGADLSSARFYGVDLTSTNLSNTKLANANIDNSVLKATNLKGAILLPIYNSSYKPTQFDLLNKFVGVLIDGGTLMDSDVDTLAKSVSAYQYSVTVPFGRHFTAVAGVPTSLEFNDTGVDKMSTEMIARVKDDIGVLGKLEGNFGAQSKFKELFGGSNAQALVKFLDERVNYFTDSPSSSSSTNSSVLASNPDLYWAVHYYFNVLNGYNNNAATVAYTINTRSVKIIAPRTGIVRIGEGYKKMSVSQMSRIATLLHEARHSDCHVLPTQSQLEAWIKDVSQELENCSHTHVKCPATHDLAGEHACDQKLWGSYAVDYKFGQAVHKQCTNCTELEKQLALVEMSEAKTRLLYDASRLDDPATANPLTTYAKP